MPQLIFPAAVAITRSRFAPPAGTRAARRAAMSPSAIRRPDRHAFPRSAPMLSDRAMTIPATWMYVSRSCLGPATASASVGKIVDQSRMRNAAIGVTGVLLFTGARFAQFLEGPADAVTALRSSITADARHDDLVVLAPTRSAGRRFAGWALGYSGHSRFIAAAVERAVGSADHPEQSDTENLMRLMIELAASEVS
ncbi:BLUF domain-containing protein [Sphingomonas koreensis]|nr:BLUF domain-containing protein [Sphingomonas koreensis]